MKGERDITNRPTLPDKPNTSFKINDKDITGSGFNGDNFFTYWNSSPEEQQAQQTRLNSLNTLAQRVANQPNTTEFQETYKQNELDKFNKENQKALGNLAYTLGNSGVNGTTALDELQPFAESTAQGIKDINANAPVMAESLRAQTLANDVNNLNAVQSGINNYYNTGQNFAQNQASQNQYAWNTNNTDYANRYNQWLDDTPLEYGGFMKGLGKVMPLNAELLKREFWTGEDVPYKTSVNGNIVTNPQYQQGMGMPLLQAGALIGGAMTGNPTMAMAGANGLAQGQQQGGSSLPTSYQSQPVTILGQPYDYNTNSLSKSFQSL